MSTYMKAGGPWLYDEATGDIVGVRNMETGTNKFLLRTNADGNAVLLGADGSNYSLFGSEVKTAGAAGQYSTIDSAIAAHGDCYKYRTDYAGNALSAITATFTNGSASVTTAGTFDIQASGSTTGVPINDFFDIAGRKYKIKFRNSSTQLTLWETFQGTTGSYSVRYLRIARKTVLVLPGEFTEKINMVPGVHVTGLSRECCIFGNDAAFGGSTKGGDNSLSNITIGPTTGFLSIDTASSGAVDYAGATFTYDNVLLRATNEGNSHSGGGVHLATIPGGVVRIKNSDIHLGDEPFDLASIGESARRSRLEITSTNIQQINAHQDGGVSGGFPVYALTDIFNSTDYHDFYLSDVNIYFPDMLRNPSFAGSYGAISANGSNNTWVLSNITSNVTNTNASAAATERAGCIVLNAGTMDIDGAKLNASGSNSGGVSGIAIEVNGGTLNLSNVNAEGSQYALKVTGGTVNIRGGCRFKGGTNSIIQTGGTVNKSTSQPPILIGATSGTITALDT